MVLKALNRPIKKKVAIQSDDYEVNQLKLDKPLFLHKISITFELNLFVDYEVTMHGLWQITRRSFLQ